ncbi:MAG: single-stranded DNA-binding protein [Candidatus Aminicenantes bacterium]|nr:single-stranded DNA-binding protein [Candidatus Aminicenantes bacterium]
MRDVNSLNKVLLIGRLGQRPEIRLIPQRDRSIARFSLATNERFYNPQTNEATIRTEWHRIIAWGKLAEFCERMLDQGKQILIEGKLRTRSWQDREGNKRSSTEVEAFNIVLLGPREPQPPRAQEAEPAYPESSTAPADFPADEEHPSGGGDEGGDEVPF